MRRSLFAFAVVLLAAVSVAAQEMRPVSYVAEFQIKSGSTDWINLIKKYDKPMLDKLMADGTVLAWGLDVVVIHRGEGVTHRIWVVTRDYAGMDKVVAGFNAINVTPEDRARYLEVANLSNLHEHYMRSILLNVPEAPPAARPYRTYSRVKVKPGKGSEWRKLFEKYNKPVLDKLVADGAIHSYGVDVEDFHTEDPGWHWVWVATTNLAAFDKIDAANEKLSETERAAIALEFENVTEAGAHRDYLYRTVVTGGRSGK
ncbi:MAG: hypothetical protein ACRD2M_08275 [Terriglobales bacterium]